MSIKLRLTKSGLVKRPTKDGKSIQYWCNRFARLSLEIDELTEDKMEARDNLLELCQKELAQREKANPGATINLRFDTKSGCTVEIQRYDMLSLTESIANYLKDKYRLVWNRVKVVKTTIDAKKLKVDLGKDAALFDTMKQEFGILIQQTVVKCQRNASEAPEARRKKS